MVEEVEYPTSSTNNQRNPADGFLWLLDISKEIFVFSKGDLYEIFGDHPCI